ncbi:MAG: HipA family kinase [Terracidiphilus sp.]
MSDSLPAGTGRPRPGLTASSRPTPERYTGRSMLRTVTATRYVVPLREGGSLPAILEADDLGLYVVKFRGAGQGILALIAEVIAGEIGRALGLHVPEIILIDIDASLGRNEPDYEIRRLLKASAGLNLALDYLPGSVTFDPAARDKTTPEEASLIVWFDAFTLNVDRTAKNANLLEWHRKIYPIDHGAALYVHHDWASMHEKAKSSFAEIRNHILLLWAAQIPQASAIAQAKLTPEALTAIVALVPDAWLEAIPGNLSAGERRAGYLDFFSDRLAAAQIFEQEAMDARSRIL